MTGLVEGDLTLCLKSEKVIYKLEGDDVSTTMKDLRLKMLLNKDIDIT